ncbi:hypothetical protein [Geopsychrobacter electrodiphilus]|uniref:hypothetical protein n=1 Tax=Geopsychrobacter electrodiphilus TaxID=225196 RepID=UPI000367A09C|nr:hypothetical protein [Geopsychrobacter electrodiphilus]
MIVWNSKYKGKQQNKIIFSILSFMLLFLTVVIPNSLQLFTAAIMFFCFILSIFIVTFNREMKNILHLYFFSVTVTIIFVIVGFIYGAPSIASQQVLIIYVLSPLFWIYISTGIIQVIGIDKLINWFVVLTILCCVSISLYFFLFITYGSNSISFFKESGNLNLKDGYAGATMFVYGSLIFLVGGFFSSPEIIRNKLLKFLLLGALLCSALTSGRSALILSIPVGILIGILFPYRDKIDMIGRMNTTLNIKVVFILGFSGIVSAFLLSHFTAIDVIYLLQNFIKDLYTAGGTARSEQANALIVGIVDSLGLGVGHGIGVDYVRSYTFPWRYELVWLATILRVGWVGALVYSLPFIWYFKKIYIITKRRELLSSDKFMFSGFFCAFIASNTNPYIESFSFQWMYIIPLIALFARPVILED